MTKHPLVALLLALPLAGCLGLGGDPPPPTLFTLSSPPVASAARSASAGEAVTVSVPSVPQAIRTLRIAVRVSPTEYAYMKDAQWVEQPNRLFQRLLSDAIGGRTGLVVLDPSQTSVDPGKRLTGQLLEFGIDASDPAARRAVVRYDVVVALGDGRGVAARRFDAEQPVASVHPAAAAQALDATALQLAGAVAEWMTTIK
jgi:cholesterol transport system auxiliary component